MLSEERRRIIEAEEAGRITEETYRREVRSRMSQPESAKLTPAISVFHQEEETDGSFRFWQILALVAIIAAITYAYGLYSSTIPSSRSSTQAASAATSPWPKPVYVSVKQPVASGQIVVQPGRWVWYRIRVRSGMRNPVLSGSFSASGGAGNDITAVVATEAEFQNWINDHESLVQYSTPGRKTTDSFSISLPEGDFIFAISNKFSFLSQKTVFLNVNLQYDTLAESSRGL